MGAGASAVDQHSDIPDEITLEWLEEHTESPVPPVLAAAFEEVQAQAKGEKEDGASVVDEGTGIISKQALLDKIAANPELQALCSHYRNLHGTLPPSAATATATVDAAAAEVVPGDVEGGAAAGAPALTFAEQFTVGKKLGSGAFSIVKEAVRKETGERFAVKIVNKSKLDEEDLHALKTEIETLKSVTHPNIVCLEETFQDEGHFYLVMELVSGGELFDRIVERDHYTEREARDLVRVLLDAIACCHDAGIAHRDVKPENMLLVSHDDDWNIKLADFGFAKRVVESDHVGLVTSCGSPTYVAPEILSRATYGTMVDVWSAGVVTYILLCGYPPFWHDNQSQLLQLIVDGRYDFPAEEWDEVTDTAKSFIRRMLVVDPNERATARELLEHAWIVGDVPDTKLDAAAKQLSKFNARRKLKVAVKTVRAAVRMSHIVHTVSAASVSQSDK